MEKLWKNTIKNKLTDENMCDIIEVQMIHVNIFKNGGK